MIPSLEHSWKKALSDEIKNRDLSLLWKRITLAYADTSLIYPPKTSLFKAFELCPFSTVTVVIVGQDPYHGEGQAHGLCFSVPDGVKIPPSLRNIYTEISNDIGTKISESGNLERWAHQGVLLLNATLTVEANTPGSHHDLGWEQFTDTVIQTISNQKKHVVFLLWGKYAQSKEKCIDTTKHLVLKAPHPSPFSAHTGFFGCKHFSKTNAYLKLHRKKQIVW